MSEQAKYRGGQWQRWQMDSLERRNPERAEKQAPMRRKEDDIYRSLFELAKEEAARKAYEQGFEKGRAEGFERGHAEASEQVLKQHEQALQKNLATTLAPMHALVANFRQSIEGLNEHIAHALVELALETGRQLAGRALELKPEHILDDIEDLLEREPTLSGNPALCVNPDDLVLVQSHMGDALKAAGWQLRADNALTRGDCRIETEQREIDATSADRWERLRHAVGHGEH